jgi:hypothetical protein
VKLACAALAIVLVANGDSADKPSSREENAAVRSSAELTGAEMTGFSAWDYIPLLRNGVVPFSETKDFHDTQFEYRWKSKWAVSRYVCTVEIRPAADVDIRYQVPEISFAYSDPHSHRPFHKFTAHDVAVGGKQAHAVLRLNDCERVGLIYWVK